MNVDIPDSIVRDPARLADYVAGMGRQIEDEFSDQLQLDEAKELRRRLDEIIKKIVPGLLEKTKTLKLTPGMITKMERQLKTEGGATISELVGTCRNLWGDGLAYEKEIPPTPSQVAQMRENHIVGLRRQYQGRLSAKAMKNIVDVKVKDYEEHYRSASEAGEAVRLAIIEAKGPGADNLRIAVSAKFYILVKKWMTKTYGEPVIDKDTGQLIAFGTNCSVSPHLPGGVPHAHAGMPMEFKE